MAGCRLAVEPCTLVWVCLPMPGSAGLASVCEGHGYSAYELLLVSPSTRHKSLSAGCAVTKSITGIMEIRWMVNVLKGNDSTAVRLVCFEAAEAVVTFNLCL